MNYEVTVGCEARTLVYRDVLGTLVFTFDMDTVNGQKTIFLAPIPMTEDFKEIKKSVLSKDELARVTLALERTTQYLLSRGYHVESEGQEWT
jgi:hypothetical protein